MRIAAAVSVLLLAGCGFLQIHSKAECSCNDEQAVATCQTKGTDGSVAPPAPEGQNQ